MALGAARFYGARPVIVFRCPREKIKGEQACFRRVPAAAGGENRKQLDGSPGDVILCREGRIEGRAGALFGVHGKK